MEEDINSTFEKKVRAVCGESGHTICALKYKQFTERQVEDKDCNKGNLSSKRSEL